MIDSVSVSETWTNYQIKKGKNIVFQYEVSTIPGLMDGGTTTIVVEVPSNVTTFSYQDEKLGEVKAIYRNLCGECLASVSRRIEKGLIEGKKINNKKWLVRISVPTEGIDISETFQVK